MRPRTIRIAVAAALVLSVGANVYFVFRHWQMARDGGNALATLAWNARSHAAYAESFVKSIYEGNEDARTQLGRVRPYLNTVADSLEALHYLDPVHREEWHDMRTSVEKARLFADNQRSKLLENGSLTPEALAGIKATGSMLEGLSGAFPDEIRRGRHPQAVFNPARFEAAHRAALDYINDDLPRTAGDQAADASLDEQPDFTITSNGETTIPYESLLWSETWTKDRGWLLADAPTVFREISAVLDQLPTVTLREDISLNCAENVSLGGLYVCGAESLEMILEGADRLYLTGLAEGTYYVGIQARKTGDYIESEERHEAHGSEHVFRFVVDERSYDNMLRSRPLRDGISLMLRPTEYRGLWYFYGEAGYYVPDDQDGWLDVLERAEATATDRGWLDNEGPLGVWLKYEDDYWYVTENGALVRLGGKPRRIEAENAAELLALARSVAKRYGVNVGAFRPDVIEGIVSATLTFAGEDHTVTDPELLAELEGLLRSATRLRVVTKCPFAALLTLQLEGGDPVRIVFAADSCRVYMVDGVCFEYGCKENAEFFGLFGVTLR